LWVVGLQDPLRPRLRGELEVDGYSAYIHPLGADHLLTVGVRFDADSGRFLGLKLQIFDVADPAHPTLRHELPLGDENSGSEALVDRHAFTFFDRLQRIDRGATSSSEPTSGRIRAR
jgi:uncharacterized secreted protein with C-terminal beta-propeller domain